MGCSETRMESEKDSSTRFSLDNQYSMYAAIQSNNFKMFSKLMDEGFQMDFQMPNFSKKTPSHIAAEFGTEYILNSLIMKGANVNIGDEYGVTPIFFAVRNRHINCALILEHNGADLSIVSKQGKTVRDYVPRGREKHYTRLFKEDITRTKVSS